jgi:hypothetical protein
MARKEKIMTDQSTEYTTTAPETKSTEEVKLQAAKTTRQKMRGKRGKKIRHGSYFGAKGAYKKQLEEAGEV